MGLFKRIQNWLIGATNKAVIPVYSAADKFCGTKDVKPNFHVGQDIWSHPITGCYEHKDENGNWVEGPALGHGYDAPEGHFTNWENPPMKFEDCFRGTRLQKRVKEIKDKLFK